MARNRMIKKEVLEDSKIGKLSDTAKWLFIGLWIIADDEGFLQSDTDWIRIKCFPYNPQIDIKKVIKELFDLNLINENNGIIKIKNFLKHQTINRPATSELCTIYRRNSVNIQGTINEDSHLNINEVKEKLKEIEVNKKENIKENKTSRIVFVKPTKTEIIDYINEKQLKVDVDVFIDYYESNGWKVGKVPMKDWKATLRNWDRKTKEVKKTFKNEFLDMLKGEQAI